MGVAWKLGTQYLRAKKRPSIRVISLIAVGGVALGVGALLSVIAITSGFETVIRDKLLDVNAHVLIQKYGMDFGEYPEVIAQAQSMPEVVAATPFVLQDMLLAHGRRRRVVLVKGIDPKRSIKVLALSRQIVSGSLAKLRHPDATKPQTEDALEGELDELLKRMQGQATQEPEPEPEPAEQSDPPAGGDRSNVAQRTPQADVPSLGDATRFLEGLAAIADDRDLRVFDTHERDASTLPGVALGATLAEELRIEVGDVIEVVSPLSGLDTSLLGREIAVPASTRLRVVAIFSAGFKEYDSQLLYVDIYEAQRLRGRGDQVTGVEMKLRRYGHANRIASKLEALLSGPFYATSWQRLNRNLFTALWIQKLALSAAIATIVLVAAFNVIATLIMLVLEKRRDIAILRAMGARRHSVVGVFLVQGVAIGLGGTAIGLVLGGLVVAYLTHVPFPLDPKVYLIDHLPIQATLSEFGVTALIAMLICTLATIPPSLWAALLTPVEGLRRS